MIIILSICIGWFILFFGGGYLISKSISVYFDDKIRITGIDVQPNLDIRINRLDYFSRGSELEASSDFSIRFINLDWSVFTQGPSITATIGPTSLRGRHRVDNAIISFTPKTLGDLTNGQIEFLLNRIEVEGVGSAKNVIGQTSLSKNVLTNLRFDISDVNFTNWMNIFVPEMRGSISEVSINKQVFDQQNNIELIIGKINHSKLFTTKTPLNLIITNNYGDVSLTMDPEEVRFLNPDLVVNRPVIKLEYNVGSRWRFQNANITADGLNLSDLGLELNALATTIEGEEDNYEATFTGNIIPSSILINDRFIGRVYNGTIGSSFQILIEKDFIKVNANAKLGVKSVPALNAGVDLVVGINSPHEIFNCDRQGCLDYSLDSNYFFDLAGEKVLGFSECIEACRGRTISNESHKLISANTSMFFEKLARTKLLNPIVLATLYSYFLNGEKSKNGHELFL